MKKILLTIAIAATSLLFTSSVNAQQIVTGNSNSNTVVINCINGTHVNSNNTGCVANNPGNPGGPTPTPPSNPGNPGNPGGGTGPGGGSSCSAGIPGNVYLASVVKVSSNSVKLTWTPASGASDYTIEYGTSSNSYSYGVPSTGNVTTFVVGSLDLSKSYFFKIIALNGCAQGNASNEVSNLMGLSNTSSQDSSFIILAAALMLGAAGLALFFKTLRNNA